MRSFQPDELPQMEVFKTLLSGVAPRPIALVATLDASGTLNLSPFSFFNAFGSNPPIVAFSPSYRGRDGSSKDTFKNLLASRECTISVVNHAIVEQISLASSDYAPEINEFDKAGLQTLPSRNINTPGVAQSPFVMECSLLQHVDTGGKPGSGNIMICRVERFHVAESAYGDDGRLDPQRLDLVARMGYDYYCRAIGEAVFELPKPKWNGIGMDALPEDIRTSRILSGNQLAMLAGVAEIPAKDESFGSDTLPLSSDLATEIRVGAGLRALAVYRDIRSSLSATEQRDQLHRIAAVFLDQRKIDDAWQTLLAFI